MPLIVKHITNFIQFRQTTCIVATAKIRLPLRANKTSKTKKIHYDWSALLTDDKVRSQYTIEVKNQFQEL